MPKVSAGYVLAFLVAACSGPGQDGRAGPDETMERAAVERAVTDWQNAVGRVDTASVARLVTPTVQIVLDSVWYDRDGLLESVASLPELMGGPFEVTFTFSDWRTRVKGDVAWTTFRNHSEWVPEAGDPFPMEWLETAVLRKEGGAWLIDRYHSTTVSLDPEG